MFEQFWNYALPIGGGITVGTIIVAIGSLVWRAVSKKFTNKLNKTLDLKSIEKTISDVKNKTTEETLAMVKDLSFKQTIQPIAESGLKKVTEEAHRYIDETLGKVDERYAQLLLVLEKFACYFDDSIAINDKEKLELKQALEEAKKDLPRETIVKVEEVIVSKENTAENGDNDVKQAIGVER